MGYITAKKSKLYPNKDTRIILNKTLGCCRFVWNQLLGKNQYLYRKWLENDASLKPNTSISYFNQELNKLKAEHLWLNKVSAVALQQSVINLSKTFSNFFQGKVGYPKFKSKKHSGGFRIVGVTSVTLHQGKVKIPKTEILTSSRPHLETAGRVTSYTVIKDSTGDYFINLVTTVPYLDALTKGTGFVGIDLGIKSLALVQPAGGEAWELENNRTYIKFQRKRTQLSRKLSKKVKGSNNRNKARIKLAKLERKVANIRNDLLHKFTTKLINENQVISLEDLNVKGMLKNHKLAKHIADCGFGIIRNMIEYKVKRFERPVQVSLVNRFYPSTQICSACGVKREIKLTLKDREWTCPTCGVVHDRDINAATNILNEGLRLAG